MEKLVPLLSETLSSCNLNVIYSTVDYIMAKEAPGKVPFPKLVTVEALIDRTTATDKEVKMNLVVKNEELPLQVDNHCHQMFEIVSAAVKDDENWKVLGIVSGD